MALQEENSSLKAKNFGKAEAQTADSILNRIRQSGFLRPNNSRRQDRQFVPVPVVESPSANYYNPPAADADYQSVLTYATDQGYVLPSQTVQELGSALVTTLKTEGVWDKLDIFYMFATDGDEDFASINWKDTSSYVVDRINSPSFIPSTGFAGNGTNAYLNTNWIPASGSNFSQSFSSHGCFVYYNTPNIQVSSQANIGFHGHISGSSVYNILNIYSPYYGNSFFGYYVNTSGASNYEYKRGVIAPRFLLANVTASTIEPYDNANSTFRALATASVTTSTLPTSSVVIMQRGINGSNWYTPSNVFIQADFWGSYLTEAEATTLYTSLNTYFSNI